MSSGGGCGNSKNKIPQCNHVMWWLWQGWGSDHQGNHLLFVFLYGTHPLAQTLCSCGGSPDLHRVELRVVGVAAPDLGNNSSLYVVLQPSQFS